MPRSIHCRDICVCDRKIILRNSTAFNFTDYVICCDKQRSAVGVGGDRRHEVLAHCMQTFGGFAAAREYDIERK
jgi:hypothetical protein